MPFSRMPFSRMKRTARIVENWRFLACILFALYACPGFGQDIAVEQNTAVSASACYSSLQARIHSTQPCEAALAATIDDVERARIASTLAMLHAQANELAIAQQWMDEALQIHPGDSVVLVNLGNLRIKQGRFDEAVQVYSNVQTLLESKADPAPSVLFLNRALALRALGRYADAKRDFDYYVYLHSTGQAVLDDARAAEQPQNRGTQAISSDIGG